MVAACFDPRRGALFFGFVVQRYAELLGTPLSCIETLSSAFDFTSRGLGGFIHSVDVG
jgi:hypothetical protein